MRVKQEQRIADLETVISGLLAAGCEVASETDGDISCFFCGAYFQGGDDHDDDCPYVKAKRLLGRV